MTPVVYMEETKTWWASIDWAILANIGICFGTAGLFVATCFLARSAKKQANSAFAQARAAEAQILEVRRGQFIPIFDQLKNMSKLFHEVIEQTNTYDITGWNIYEEFWKRFCINIEEFAIYSPVWKRTDEDKQQFDIMTAMTVDVSYRLKYISDKANRNNSHQSIDDREILRNELEKAIAIASKVSKYFEIKINAISAELG